MYSSLPTATLQRLGLLLRHLCIRSHNLINLPVTLTVSLRMNPKHPTIKRINPCHIDEAFTVSLRMNLKHPTIKRINLCHIDGAFTVCTHFLFCLCVVMSALIGLEEQLPSTVTVTGSTAPKMTNVNPTVTAHADHLSHNSSLRPQNQINHPTNTIAEFPMTQILNLYHINILLHRRRHARAC